MFLIFDTETTGFPKDWNAPYHGPRQLATRGSVGLANPRCQRGIGRGSGPYYLSRRLRYSV